ncbi:hypothetical protein QFZ69_000316 [Arthrobacter sp. V1I7]|nr:hypothetical protein [Arthrobacter sp. V1I7]
MSNTFNMSPLPRPALVLLNPVVCVLHTVTVSTPVGPAGQVFLAPVGRFAYGTFNDAGILAAWQSGYTLGSVPPVGFSWDPVNDTLKGQLDLEQHCGRTPAGVMPRIVQRLLAMTTAIWHNDSTGATIRRSLTAYDH